MPLCMLICHWQVSKMRKTLLGELNANLELMYRMHILTWRTYSVTELATMEDMQLSWGMAYVMHTCTCPVLLYAFQE